MEDESKEPQSDEPKEGEDTPDQGVNEPVA